MRRGVVRDDEIGHKAVMVSLVYPELAEGPKL